jgi:Cd2+/Zn2+-exporting ATPase
MVEKSKVEVLNVLDDIGCGCGSCDDDQKQNNTTSQEPIQLSQSFNVLDDIGCGCGSCEEPVKEQISFDVLDDIGCDCCDDDHATEVKKDKKELTGFPKFIKENIQLIISFVLFFTALFTKFDDIIELGLYIAAYLLVSRGVLKSAVKSIFKGRMLDENFLMSIASLVAFGIGEYAEGVAVMLFYAVGQLTEEYAINRSKRSISSILDLRPDFANIKTGNGIKKVDPSSVQLGDVIVVKPGERVPLDGVILKGTTQIDSAMLTGESLPVEATINTEVYSGTINMSAVIEVEVTRMFADSAVSKILSMVQRANDNKAPTEKFITKFAKVYTPIVVIGAVLIAIVPPLLLGQSFDTWMYRGAIFLVVSCPCALVISVPLGYFGGIGGAARKGILVKGGQFLEVLKKTETIVFDKTGTLTKGNFSVESIDVLGKLSEADILKYSAHIESLSNHPIAVAIVKAYDGKVDESQVHDVKEIAGKGLIATFNNQDVCIGNDALMKELNISLPEHETIGTTLYLSVNGTLEGILHINDEIKEKTLEGLKQLKSLGVKKFVMLTGDRAKIANSVGSKLGIDEIHSELLPEDKLSILESILETDKNVVFIGDGINDAPVLTRADAGIAMGNLGSDVAIESSDVVLMTDEVTAVADGIRVSRFTSKIILQNIIFALGVKILIMILGTMGMATLWMAIFGDVGVAFIAILNSGRAIYSK